MKNIKKIISAFICLTVILSLIPTMAFALPDDISSEFFYYKKSDGTVAITGYKGNESSLVIPDAIDGYRVTSISEEAFIFNYNLTSVVLPDSVTSIGRAAFYACDKLADITIPDSVTAIGDSAFYNTAYYKNLDNWQNDVLFIGVHLICAKDSISGDYTVPSGTKTIADGAFWGCDDLISVTIPESVTSIYEDALKYCDGLTEISVASDNPVYSSQDGVLFNKDKTQILTFPQGRTGEYVIPDSIEIINDFDFTFCALTSVVIPESVTSIGGSAFSHCDNLTSVTIPDSVTDIEMFAFFYSAYYKNPDNWENGVLYIGNHLIAAEKTVSGDYTVTSGTITIADSAFANCVGLTSVEIPGSVITVGNGAFHYCTSLESVTLSYGLKNIKSGAFNGCDKLTSITIPDSVVKIGYNAFLKTGYYNNSNNWKDGMLTAGCHLISAKTSVNGVCNIPSGIKIIADQAFASSCRLIAINMPDGLTYIGEKAFADCGGLSYVTMPESIISIGKGAFQNCAGLCHVLYKGDEENWNNIEIDSDGNGSLTSATRHYNATGDEVSYLITQEPTFTATGEKNIFCTECSAPGENRNLIHTQVIGKVENPFTDVDINAWYSKPISFALYFNIFSGMSPTTFEPNSSMTRAMFVTVLGRLDGAVNDKNKGTVFTDVPTGEWYSGYIAWAAENEIVSGTSPTTFAPNSNITRQEMCVIMNNYCKYAGITLTPQVEKKTFLDSQDVAGWAKNAVEICQLAGLVTGKTETKQGVYFEPLGKATRAEVATILRKFCINF